METVTPAYKIMAGQGYISAFVCPIITANSDYTVPILQTDIDKYSFFNVVNVVNNSLASDVLVYLDGNAGRSVKVVAGFDKNVTGSRFRNIVVHNNTANDTVAGDIYVTIQKELGNREIAELKQQGAA